MVLRTLLALIVGLVAVGAARAADVTINALAQSTHFHGIAPVPDDPSAFYLATHHGLWLGKTDGTARSVSQDRHDFMGFTPHPADPATLFASGHPATGGNLGLIVSTDRGRSWRKLSDGVRGPVDFHQMDVSKADPNVIYGVHGGLQRSSDGGRSWTVVGPAPRQLIAIAASRRDANVLYAATESGLLRSGDGGRSWAPAHPAREPATAVHVTAAGQVYAYLLGAGLVRGAETVGAPVWQATGGRVDGYLLHLATADGRRLFAVAINPRTRTPAVVTSGDGGASWIAVGAR